MSGSMSVTTARLRALAGRWAASADELARSHGPQAFADVGRSLPGSRAAWVAGQVGQLQAERVQGAARAVQGLASTMTATSSTYDATDHSQAQSFGSKAGG